MICFLENHLDGEEIIFDHSGDFCCQKINKNGTV